MWFNIYLSGLLQVLQDGWARRWEFAALQSLQIQHFFADCIQPKRNEVVKEYMAWRLAPWATPIYNCIVDRWTRQYSTYLDKSKDLETLTLPWIVSGIFKKLKETLLQKPAHLYLHNTCNRIIKGEASLFLNI